MAQSNHAGQYIGTRTPRTTRNVRLLNDLVRARYPLPNLDSEDLQALLNTFAAPFSGLEAKTSGPCKVASLQ